MDDAQKALVKVLAEALDQLQLGMHGGRGRYGKPGEYAREHFAKINRALAGARHLDAIPMSTPTFSREEVTQLGGKMRSLGALNMTDQIGTVFIEALRNRGISEDILSSIASCTAEIATAFKSE